MNPVAVMRNTVLAARKRLGSGTPPNKFRGTFATYREALAVVQADLLAGYDNDEVAQTGFDDMCLVKIWDYPVLFWLSRLVPRLHCLVDAGGHMATKFRAFVPYLDLPAGFDWAIYDLPAVVRAAQAKAAADGLRGVSFHERIETTPAADLLLASGLLQYLDIPLEELVSRMPNRPRHLLLNKVATRDGPTLVTLERFPGAEVPYQIRNRSAFESELTEMGYAIRDSWEIAGLSHRHGAFGQSVSRGYYAERA